MTEWVNEMEESTEWGTCRFSSARIFWKFLFTSFLWYFTSGSGTEQQPCSLQEFNDKSFILICYDPNGLHCYKKYDSFQLFFFTNLILLCIMHPKTTEDVMIMKSVKALTAMAANVLSEMIINGSPPVLQYWDIYLSKLTLHIMHVKKQKWWVV